MSPVRSSTVGLLMKTEWLHMLASVASQRVLKMRFLHPTGHQSSSMLKGFMYSCSSLIGALTSNSQFLFLNFIDVSTISALVQIFIRALKDKRPLNRFFTS